MSTKRKRIAVIADFHSGHLVGLTYPDFERRAQPNPGTKLHDCQRFRRAMWRYYSEKVEELKPIELLIVNGDCIDGKGSRSGGTELLFSDRGEQASCAAALINMWNAPMVLMSYGTPYHVGADEDWEDEVFKEVQTKDKKIGGHDWVAVNGLTFSYRHFLGSSSVPYGRFTSLAKERTWEMEWAKRNEYPLGDVLLRSHVHYFKHAGDADWLGIITPALQGYGSKYGARKMSGTVDFGLVHFDVGEDGLNDLEWHAHIRRFRWGKQDMTSL